MHRNIPLYISNQITEKKRQEYTIVKWLLSGVFPQIKNYRPVGDSTRVCLSPETANEIRTGGSEVAGNWMYDTDVRRKTRIPLPRHQEAAIESRGKESEYRLRGIHVRRERRSHRRGRSFRDTTLKDQHRDRAWPPPIVPARRQRHALQ